MLLVLLVTALRAAAQIDLGSFNLKPGPNGLLDLGFNQGGSLFGFGGDRGFNAQIGQGLFGLTGNQGLTLGGQRVGTDSGLSFGQGGLGLGSALNFGNGAPSTKPAGDFNSFLEGISSFFKNFVPPQPASIPGQAPVVGVPSMPDLLPTLSPTTVAQPQPDYGTEEEEEMVTAGAIDGEAVHRETTTVQGIETTGGPGGAEEQLVVMGTAAGLSPPTTMSAFPRLVESEDTEVRQ